MDYVPTRKLVGNQVYVLTAMLAHNLNRELQMQSLPKARPNAGRRCGNLKTRYLAAQTDSTRRALDQTASATDADNERECPVKKSDLLNYLDRLKHVAYSQVNEVYA